MAELVQFVKCFLDSLLAIRVGRIPRCFKVVEEEKVGVLGRVELVDDVAHDAIGLALDSKAHVEDLQEEAGGCCF